MKEISKCCKVNESAFGTCANCGLPFVPTECYCNDDRGGGYFKNGHFSSCPLFSNERTPCEGYPCKSNHKPCYQKDKKECNCVCHKTKDPHLNCTGCEEREPVTPIEEAILALAEYLEDPMHDQYKVKKHIAEILGVEFIKS